MTPRRLIAPLLLSLVLAPLAGAQQNRPARQPARTDKPIPVAIKMSEQPFHIESVGLSMMLPSDARAEGTSVGGRTTTRILPGGDASTWLLNIQTPVDPEEGRTSSDLLEELLRHLGEAAGMVYKSEGGKRLQEELLGVEIKFVEPRQTVTISGQPAERIYISLPGRAGTPRVVRGYTVFKTAPRQFVSFELVTTESEFAASRPVYETIVATAKFENADELRTARAGAVTAGLKLFETISPEDLAAVVRDHAESWERLYRPSATGAASDAEELGYVRIQLKTGTPDDLSRGAASGNVGNRRQGYIVQIDARFIDNGQVGDTNSAFFMSLDRQHEVWTVRQAIRRWKAGENAPSKEGAVVITELGARDGANMIVELSTPGKPKETVKPIMQGDGYISRVEAYLLPYLMIRKGLTTEFGFYSYDSRQSTIRLRRDTLDQPEGAGGVWRVTTLLSEEDRPQVATFAHDAALLRIQLPDGRFREPTTGPKLLQLWKSKGLPVE